MGSERADNNPIRDAIIAAGFDRFILLDEALRSECSSGGVFWNDEHGWMNPAVALTLAELLARDPIQTRAAFSHTPMQVVARGVRAAYQRD